MKARELLNQIAALNAQTFGAGLAFFLMKKGIMKEEDVKLLLECCREVEGCYHFGVFPRHMRLKKEASK